jgi:heptosyltransferase-2
MFFGRGMVESKRLAAPGGLTPAWPRPLNPVPWTLALEHLPYIRRVALPLRILIVRLSSMGDIILTTPLIRALRARHPEAEITFLTKRSFAPLVADSPHLTRVIAYHPAQQSLLSLAKELRAARYTHLLDLHGTLRGRALRLLVPGPWRGYRKRRVEREVLIRFKKNIYRDNVPEPERYFEAAADLDVRPDGQPPEMFVHPDAQERADAWLRKALPNDRPLVALVPGAAHFTKRWPVESWQALAAKLGKAGHAIVVLGGPEYARECTAIAAAGGPHAANAAGPFGLQETAAVLGRSQVCIVGDTGVMHMASATRTPIALLLGPTVGTFGFLPYRAESIVIERDMSCRPCSAQGGPRCPLGHHRCLREISAEQVLVAAGRYLSGR